MPQANLPDPELAALCDALYTVTNHARHAIDGDPVEPALVRVLAAASRLGPLRPSDLACSLRLDLSTVSRHLRTLQASGLVDVAPDPDDRRAQQVRLTDAGAAAFETVMDNRRAAIGGVVEHWEPADRAALTDLLCRLADDMATASEARGRTPRTRETA